MSGLAPRPLGSSPHPHLSMCLCWLDPAPFSLFLPSLLEGPGLGLLPGAEKPPSGALSAKQTPLETEKLLCAPWAHGLASSATNCPASRLAKWHCKACVCARAHVYVCLHTQLRTDACVLGVGWPSFYSKRALLSNYFQKGREGGGKCPGGKWVAVIEAEAVRDRSQSGRKITSVRNFET